MQIKLPPFLSQEWELQARKAQTANAPDYVTLWIPYDEAKFINTTKAVAELVREKWPDVPLKIAAKASFGFGDVNSCIIFRKWEEGHG